MKSARVFLLEVIIVTIRCSLFDFVSSVLAPEF